jgi:hypothetical protein
MRSGKKIRAGGQRGSATFRCRCSAFLLCHFFLLALFVFGRPTWAASAKAQDDETPAPKKSGVKLQFIPPPMDGVFSLGIYDAKGKLIRTLHREAKLAEFTAALDGLITFWNGKDDTGAPVPAGKYAARGWCVGDEVKVKPIPLNLNDSAAPEKSPAPSPQPGNPLPISSPSPQPISASPSPTATPGPSVSPPAATGSIMPSEMIAAPGPPPSPIPILEASKPVISKEQLNVFNTLDSVKDKLKTPDGKAFAPEEKIKLKLTANPLEKDKPGTVEVAAGFDDKGSFLKTADGRRFHETARRRDRWCCFKVTARRSRSLSFPNSR